MIKKKIKLISLISIAVLIVFSTIVQAADLYIQSSPKSQLIGNDGRTYYCMDKPNAGGAGDTLTLVKKDDSLSAKHAYVYYQLSHTTNRPNYTPSASDGDINWQYMRHYTWRINTVGYKDNDAAWTAFEKQYEDSQGTVKLVSDNAVAEAIGGYKYKIGPYRLQIDGKPQDIKIVGTTSIGTGNVTQVEVGGRTIEVNKLTSEHNNKDIYITFETGDIASLKLTLTHDASIYKGTRDIYQLNCDGAHSNVSGNKGRAHQRVCIPKVEKIPKIEEVPLPFKTGFSMKIYKVSNGIPLAGAVFSLQDINDGGMHYTATTDASGNALILPNRTIVADGRFLEFTIEERTAPVGYKKLEKPIFVRVVLDSENNLGVLAWDLDGNPVKSSVVNGAVIIEIENEPEDGSFRIRKVNELGGVLEGAEFSVTSSKGFSGTITAGNTWVETLSLQNRDSITYTITEIKEPNGYKKITDRFTVTIRKEGGVFKSNSPNVTIDSTGKIVTFTLKNEKIPPPPDPNDKKSGAYIEGWVWEEMPSQDKISSDANGIYDSGEGAVGSYGSELGGSGTLYGRDVDGATTSVKVILYREGTEVDSMTTNNYYYFDILKGWVVGDTAFSVVFEYNGMRYTATDSFAFPGTRISTAEENMAERESINSTFSKISNGTNNSNVLDVLDAKITAISANTQIIGVGTYSVGGKNRKIYHLEGQETTIQFVKKTYSHKVWKYSRIDSLTRYVPFTGIRTVGDYPYDTTVPVSETIPPDEPMDIGVIPSNMTYTMSGSVPTVTFDAGGSWVPQQEGKPDKDVNIQNEEVIEKYIPLIRQETLYKKVVVPKYGHYSWREIIGYEQKWVQKEVDGVPQWKDDEETDPVMVEVDDKNRPIYSSDKGGNICEGYYIYTYEFKSSIVDSGKESVFIGLPGANNNVLIDASIHATMEQNGKEIDIRTEYVKTGVSQSSDPRIVRNEVIHQGHTEVNLGLKRRDLLNFEVRKDLELANVYINQREFTYTYGRKFDENQRIDNKDLTQEHITGYIGKDGAIGDNGAVEDYNVEVKGEDYYFNYDDETGYTNTNGYNQHVKDAGYYSQEDNEIKMYLTYKIIVQNTSPIKEGEVYELVDYYDSSMELMWVATSKDGSGSLTYENASQHGSTTGSYTGYETIFIQLNEGELSSGDKITIYMRFEINKAEIDDKRLLVWEPSTTKENVMEISCYGNKDGLLDMDRFETFTYKSVPANYDPVNKVSDAGLRNPERDHDRAPSAKLELEDTKRQVTGYAWEDLNDNGIMESNEPKIPHVTVYLVEKTQQNNWLTGEEYIWARTTTDANGYYTFGSQTDPIIPGIYIVRFAYGHTGTLPANPPHYLTGEPIRYSGQDFETTRTSNNGIMNSVADNKNDNDALDNFARREVVKNYSNLINNTKGNILALTSEQWRNDLAANTHMYADTGMFEVEVEVNPDKEEVALEDKDTVRGYKERLQDINAGLKERPTFNMTVDKEVRRVQIITADGKTLYDTNNVFINPLSGNNIVDFTKTWDLTELGQGTTVRIEYAIIVTNTGELPGQVTIIEYLDKDVTFNVNDNRDSGTGNPNWERASSTRELGDRNSVTVSGIEDTGVSKLLADAKTEVVISKKTRTLSAGGDKEEIPFVLSKVIGPDGIEIDNYAEIYEYFNDEGRRQYGDIPANYNTDLIDPDDEYEFQEEDIARARIAVIPPFGENRAIYFVLGTIAIIMLGAGAVLVKKYVLK